MNNPMGDELERAFSLYYEDRFAESERICRELLETDPKNHRAVFLLGHLAKRGGMLDYAIELFSRALSFHDDDAQYYFALANVLRNRGCTEEAVHYLESGIQVNSTDAAAHQTLGSFLSDLGRFDASSAAFKKAIDLDPKMGSAHYGLALITRYHADDPHLALMEDLIKKRQLKGQELSRTAFALGKAYEQLKNYDRAFEYFDLGNRERRAIVDYNLEEDRRNNQRLIDSFSAKLFQDKQGLGYRDQKPIFIVGMPRSGSTLLEQILSSHPDITGAGELMTVHNTVSEYSHNHLTEDRELPESVTLIPDRDWEALGRHYVQSLDEIAAKTPRVIDKQLFNYTYVGMIALMLPEATIINCTRDPMDTCVSCYTNSFLADRGFTYDLKELGHAYNLYETLMAHWDKVLPGRIVHVRYEELVADLETTAKQLIQRIGLPWSDACLDYYKNKRSVTTSSLSQVRQPTYKSSIGRWRHYEKYLGTLISILAHDKDTDKDSK